MNLPLSPSFLLYGANGYTAKLIIDRAKSFGLTPVLAGRSTAKLKHLAEQYGLTYRVADLNDAVAVDAMLLDVAVVLHCAGPFSKTAAPMQQACVWNAQGQTIEARLHGPEGYTLTALTALLITKKVLDGNWKAGYQTPAGLYGADLILDIEGITREEIKPL